jgi:hypothetical protein
VEDGETVAHNLQVQRVEVIPRFEVDMELVDELVDNVVVGDSVDVLCYSSTKESFQIMLCEKPLHVVEVGFKDGWGPRLVCR